jgi:asparagine synthase (glutamine-hydrolysing)
MCGIFGTVNYRISREEFQQQLDKIKHRGPDGYGIWENKTGNVKLGHRRLAIIDTDSRSNQPMLFGDRYAIVFNGEIYNYIEIKKELEQKGIRFVTASDTEVLLRLMIEEGPTALNKLNGMWSFVIYDDVEQTLLMSRDRIGKKPLYYISEGEQIAFASEMKSLYKLIPAFSYNRQFIAYALENPMDNEALPETLINGINKFPPGHYAVYANGHLQIKQYYFPEELLHQKPLHKNFNEAVEQFNELFQSSCKLRMRSDVPVGSALSGGIDSGFVVSTLGKLGFGRNGSYTALVASFPGSFLDETKEALAVAANAGVDARQVTVKTDQRPNDILKAVYDFEELYVTTPMPFFQTYKGFREQGIVVTLDGHGGDELFGGYPFDLGSKIQDDFPNIFKMRQTLSVMNRMYGNDTEATIPEVWAYFKTETVRRRKLNGKISFFEKEQYYRKQLFQSTFYGILPTLLRNYDHYSMHAGVEVRMPFLDYRILAFAFTLPNEYKIRNNFSKAIVREAAKGILPPEILWNKKKIGWNSPLGELLSGEWKTWLIDEVNSTSFRNCDLVNHTKVQELLTRFYSEFHNDHSTAQSLWYQLQPYFVEKANRLYAVEHA